MSCSYPAPWGKEITQLELQGITRIGSFAFDGAKLTNADIPSSVTVIGNDAFAHSSLTTVTLHEGLETIQSWAFSNNNLKNIILPESLKHLQGTIFNKTNIKSIVLPDSLFKTGGTIEDSSLSGITTIYCSQESAQQCSDWLETAINYPQNTLLKNTAELKIYETDRDYYFFQGQWYARPGDISADNHIKKRIYTVGEAIKASKPTGNRVSIRYK